MCSKKFLGMDKVFALAILLVLCLVKNALSAPYANDYPYQKYGFNRETSQGDSDTSRFSKSKLRDQDGRLKVNSDTGLIYNLDSNTNKHDLHQIKRGGTTDNLTHVQGEDFETDKSHKRKHIKSGFQNSYHKDENGSRSSYYEDSDDTGGKTIYDKRHGTRGDQQESQHTEGLKNGVSRDKYDDRKTGFDNRDHADRQQTYVEDQGKQHGYVDNFNSGKDDRFEIVRRPYSEYRDHYLPRLPPRRQHDDQDFDRYDQSNHWGYDARLPPQPIARLSDRRVDNLDRNSDLIGRSNFDSVGRHSESIGRHSDSERNSDSIGRHSDLLDRRSDLLDRRSDSIAAPAHDFQTRRKITIYEDPRDEFPDSDAGRSRDNGNFMTRSEVTRKFDYGPADRTSLRLRYRGLQ